MQAQPLFDYQVQVNEFTADKTRVGIFLPYGRGKTYLGLHWIEELTKRAQPFPALILTLPSLILPWRDKILSLYDKDCKVLPLVGSQKQRAKLLATPADIYIAHYDIGRSLPMWSKLLAKGFQTVIADESSRLKESRTQRFQRLSILAKPIPYRSILAGRFILEKADDLFAQMLFLDDGQTFGKSYFRFRHEYFNPGPKWAPYEWTLKPDAAERITTKMAQSCICLAPEGIPTEHQRILLDLEPEQQRMYNELQEYFQATLPDGYSYQTKWAMTRTDKMHQLCQGFFYKPDGSVQLLHRTKIDWLVDNVPLLLHEGPLLLWSNYPRWLSAVSDALKDIPHGLYISEKTLEEREQMRIDFQTGKIDLLLLSEQLACRGLDLQRAPHALFISTGYSFDERDNAEGRNNRIGSECYDHITYYDLCIRNTVDEAPIEAITSKKEIGDVLMNLLARKHTKH